MLDGLPYCTNQPLSTVETDLMTQPGLNQPGTPGITIGSDVAMTFSQSVGASVIFTTGQLITNVNAYVILQGDYGDNYWYDLSGCVLTGTVNPPAPGQVVAQFLLLCGPYNSNTIGVLQQTRQAGTPPVANFYNASITPGRIRFVGKATGTLSGSGAGLLATITFRRPGSR